MPALVGLNARIGVNPDWQKQFDSSLELALRCAMKTPLVHVFGSGNSLANMVLRDESLEISSPERRPSTCDSEDRLRIGRCLYLYAGRAFRAKGGIALVFSAGILNGKTGGVTPFDTGGLVHRNPYTQDVYIKTDLGTDDAVLAAFVEASTVRFEEWKDRFRDFLAAYFGKVRDYFVGRPSRLDPERLYHTEFNNTWLAWTFEVRCRESQKISHATLWSASKQQMDLYKARLASSTASERDVLQNFLVRTKSPGGLFKYARGIEQLIFDELFPDYD